MESYKEPKYKWFPQSQVMLTRKGSGSEFSELAEMLELVEREKSDHWQVRKTRDPITGFKDRIITSGLAKEEELKAIDKVRIVSYGYLLNSVIPGRPSRGGRVSRHCDD